MKLRFMNHETNIHVNMAPSGIKMLAVNLSKISIKVTLAIFIPKKSISKMQQVVSMLNAIDTIDVVRAAHLRLNLNSSAKYAVRTS